MYGIFLPVNNGQYPLITGMHSRVVHPSREREVKPQESAQTVTSTDRTIHHPSNTSISQQPQNVNVSSQPSQNIAVSLPQSQNTTYVQQSQNISANLQQSQNITPNASIQPPQNIAQQPQNGSASKQQSQNVSISAHQAQNVTTTNVQHVQNIPANLQQSQNITTNIHQSQNVASQMTQESQPLMQQNIQKQVVTPPQSISEIATKSVNEVSSKSQLGEVMVNQSIPKQQIPLVSMAQASHVGTQASSAVNIPEISSLLVSKIQRQLFLVNEVNGEETSESVPSGTSTVAIDNKIEQAMDLVKSHLMFAEEEKSFLKCEEQCATIYVCVMSLKECVQGGKKHVAFVGPMQDVQRTFVYLWGKKKLAK
ncbi:TSC22 domain family protein 1 [Caerostris extrusa]|uniref:TSC22 domain family protein 1 n=1 Tax=Caerostris extrusa TaxID=172846 RepID=A0AAV4Y9R7_CAEEX|nr:TSC22 domain family protein 1 [Caerostris extrusa]